MILTRQQEKALLFPMLYGIEYMERMEDYGLYKTRSNITGTNDMTDATLNVTTSATINKEEETTKQVLKDLQDSKYITKDGELVVGSSWNAIVISKNPLNSGSRYGGNDTSILLSNETFKELSALRRLLETNEKVDNATHEKIWASEAVKEILTEGK